jgi:hypothetical protein
VGGAGKNPHVTRYGAKSSYGQRGGIFMMGQLDIGNTVGKFSDLDINPI